MKVLLRIYHSLSEKSSHDQFTVNNLIRNCMSTEVFQGKKEEKKKDLIYILSISDKQVLAFICYTFKQPSKVYLMISGKREKGGWCGSAQGTENWIQVDFNQGAGVRAVVIQKPEDTHSGYVTSISVQYMLVGTSNWQYFSSDPTQPQVLSINAMIKTIHSLNQQVYQIFTISIL